MIRQPHVSVRTVVAGAVLAAAAIGAAVALDAFRSTPVWTVVAVLALVVCPVLIGVTYLMSVRPLPVPVDPVPPTRALSLNWLAPWYDATCTRLRLGPGFRTRVLEACRLKGDEHVLDVGCATGALANGAAQRLSGAGQVWGVDASPDMVRLAMQRGCASACRPHFRTGVAEQLPFNSQTFDVVLASLVLLRLPEDGKAAALAEARRVLQPDGRLIVIDLDRPTTALWRALSAPLRLLPSAKAHLNGRTRDLLQKAGFEAPRTLGRWGPLLTVWEARPLDTTLSRFTPASQPTH